MSGLDWSGRSEVSEVEWSDVTGVLLWRHWTKSKLIEKCVDSKVINALPSTLDICIN